ncbi:MAG: MATE family efflux transporter [Bacteroidales bacterium]|nr:MATE family efflux transporter [Bacteroidales bacterium]
MATKELTQGRPLPLLLKFSIPLLLGGILQQFYQLTDSAIVSNFLGVESLAAVGASSSVLFLILGFCNGCGAGMAIPIAQAFGARDYSLLRRLVANALYVAGGLSLLLATVSAMLCGSILHWINIPADIFSEAYIYLFIILVGIPGTFFYNLLANIIRALGDSRTPFLFLVFSTAMNIVLDLVFVVLCKWGVAGAGAATLIAQTLSAVLCYVFMRRNYDVLRGGDPSERGFDPSLSWRLVSVGAPMGLQFSITAIGSIILQSANNALGTTYVAAFTAGMRLKMLFFCPLESFGMAMTTFAGQNLGAGKPERVKDGIKAGLLLDVIYCVAALAFIWPMAGPLVRIFVDASETAIIGAAVYYLRVCTLFFITLGTLCLFRYTIQGLGFTNFAMWSGVMEMIARIAVAKLLVGPFGFTAVAFNDPAAWVAANLFLIPAFISVYRKVQIG